MQDLRTGEMKPLDLKALGIQELSADDAWQRARDIVIPNRVDQGPVFTVGEILNLKGGRFEVRKIHPGGLALRSLPRE